MAELPVYIRIGDGEEHHVGSITSPEGMDPLLRAAATAVKEELRRMATTVGNRQIDTPERNRQL